MSITLEDNFQIIILNILFMVKVKGNTLGLTVIWCKLSRGQPVMYAVSVNVQASILDRGNLIVEGLIRKLVEGLVEPMGKMMLPKGH